MNGSIALGTPGIDFRQQFATLGRAHLGTLKIGRDLGLFGQEAILNDMTLLGAGSPGLCHYGQHQPRQRHSGPHRRRLCLHRLPAPDHLQHAYPLRPVGRNRNHVAV